MKKFLKSKAHQDALAHLDAESKAAVNINPPLPLDPPPPDSPPAPPYPDNDEKSMLSDEILQNIKKEAPDEYKFKEPEPVKAKIMCRDFVRGTCVRPNCKYLHKHDVKQLGKVYTFCHNFQNRDCRHPNCKFAHATVFEEGVYRRTGYLPPHALAHHKKPKLLPPPPPPPENTEEMPELTINTAIPEQTTMPGLTSMEMSVHSPDPTFADLASFWTDASSCNTMSSSSEEASCESCEINLNREQHTMRRAESISKSVQDCETNMQSLLMKTVRLDNVLSVLLNIHNMPEGSRF